MQIGKTKLRLPEWLFWDTHYAQIDPDDQYPAVITRVFDYGDWEEVKEVIAYYGEKKVKKTLLNTRYIRHRAVRLACSLFNLNPTDFKCYTNTWFQKGY